MIRRSGEGSQYTFTRFTETLTLKVFPPSICRVSAAFDKVTTKTVAGLYKNEAMTKGLPFCQSPAKTLMPPRRLASST